MFLSHLGFFTIFKLSQNVHMQCTVYYGFGQTQIFRELTQLCCLTYHERNQPLHNPENIYHVKNPTRLMKFLLNKFKTISNIQLFCSVSKEIKFSLQSSLSREPLLTWYSVFSAGSSLKKEMLNNIVEGTERENEISNHRVFMTIQ